MQLDRARQNALMQGRYIPLHTELNGLHKLVLGTQLIYMATCCCCDRDLEAFNNEAEETLELGYMVLRDAVFDLRVPASVGLGVSLLAYTWSWLK